LFSNQSFPEDLSLLTSSKHFVVMLACWKFQFTVDLFSPCIFRFRCFLWGNYRLAISPHYVYLKCFAASCRFRLFYKPTDPEINWNKKKHRHTRRTKTATGNKFCKHEPQMQKRGVAGEAQIVWGGSIAALQVPERQLHKKRKTAREENF